MGGMTDKQSRTSEARIDEASPNEVLAGEVISALVADGLISPADGATLKALLASGNIDASKWRYVFENQLQRKVDGDASK